MCSTEESCECEAERRGKKDKLIRRLKCVRCGGSKGQPALVIRSDDPALCRFCFVDGCVHKFKSAFGKSQLVPSGSRVAVAYSGGLGSTVMLDLIQHSKVRFKPVVFHLVGTDAHKPKDLEPIRSRMEESGLEFHVVDPLQNRLLIAFRSQLGSTGVQSDLSGLAEAESLLMRLMLVHSARQLGCEFLLLGTCGTRQAANFLNGIVSGRGRMASLDTTFVDRRYKYPVVLRPLFEFMSKELVFYAHFQQLNWVAPQDPVTEAVLQRPGLTTVSRLCEDFLAGLQFTGFPSTTQTILSTASKLVTASTDSLSNTSVEQCQLCLALILPSPDLLSPHKLALASLAHSFSLSDNAPVYRGTKCNGENMKEDGEEHQNPLLCTACKPLYVGMTTELRSTFRRVLHQLHSEGNKHTFQ
ncbi:Cytoplasmic tRNA 2-thiolation protein 2 [Fasciola hepatica]|uniref:Cytoplasmic tRNA 2-thiolation protein 2 n=1 Tax=Fasciola hepatica TaxID=6192 RepID=A0A4E0REZ7_FASHE|nr:Cytoplasmic tRNA 2-thiolation protein 2 [Fasciola hepatica]